MASRKLLILGILCVTWSTTARAELIIEVQDATITAGGSGLVDVYVRSNGSDLVNIFNLELQITGFDPSGSLRFTSVQASSIQQLTAPDYIFLNASDTNNFGYTRQDPVLTTLIGGDQRTGLTNTTVVGSNLLLARLSVEHQTPTPLTATGLYQLSLSSEGSIFADSNFAPITVLSSTPGTLKVTSVPEPGSTFLLGISLCVGLLTRHRTKKGNKWI